MIKKILLSGFLFFGLGELHAQWNKINTGTTQDMYAVDYYSANDIWIGAAGQFVKTGNGGTSWTVVNQIMSNINAPIPGNIYGLALSNSTSAIATGFFDLGNDELILNTSNGGAIWNMASNTQFSSAPRYTTGLDVFGSGAIAVGNNGHIWLSADNGASWAYELSGVNSLINDVKYDTKDTVIACGDNAIFRSVDGGLSWSPNNSFNGSLKTVTCAQKTIYVGIANSNSFLKSTDQGTTYKLMNMPFGSSGVLYAVDANTVLASGLNDLYISHSGGLYWEKYKLPGYMQVNRIDFFSGSGIAVGVGGYTLKTANLPACLSYPISIFSIQGGKNAFCTGDSISLADSTAPLAGYTYQWKINGSTFSTAYNSGLRLMNPGIQVLSLVVSNANGSDTSSMTLNVTGHVMAPLNVKAAADTVCHGSIPGFAISGSDANTVYCLRKGFVNISTPQNGNGATIEFSGQTPLLASTNFNILAVRTNSCYTDSLIQPQTITLSTNPEPPNSCVPAVAYCPSSGITNVTFGTINNTTSILNTNYFNYACCQHTNVVLGSSVPFSVQVRGGSYLNIWIDYNNDGCFDMNTELVYSGNSGSASGTIQISSGTSVIMNQLLRMRVANDNNPIYSASGGSCGQTEDYSVTILPAPVLPVPAFSVTKVSGCVITAQFKNTSSNAISYLWNFGDSTSSALLAPPDHAYANTGLYTVSLKTCNPTGCSTATQVVSISIPLVPIAAVCVPVINQTYGYHNGNLSWANFDAQQIASPLGSSTYKDNTCTQQLHLNAGSTYQLTLGCIEGGTLFMWIDLNNNGVFDANENLFPTGHPILNAQGLRFGMPILISDTVVQNTPLRMRIVLASWWSYDGGCETNISHSGGEADDFTVFVGPPLPVKAKFSVNQSSTTSCTDNAINFSDSTTNATHYLWDFGDGTTSTESRPNHVYKSSGVFTVKLVARNTAYADSMIRTNYITVKQGLPVPVITLNYHTLATTAPALSYQWYLNGSAVAGDTLASLVNAPTDGDYHVNVISANGCATSSNTLTYQPIRLAFRIGPKTGCDSLWVMVENAGTNASTYTIYWGDGATHTYNGLGGPYHYYHPGTYSVKLVACNGTICDSLIKTDSITVFANPVKPAITRNGTNLSTTAVAAHYQWRLNGSPISGATSTSFTMVQDGNYCLAIGNAGGCTAVSDTVSYFPIHVLFSTTTTSGCDSTYVYLTNSSSNASSYKLYWGDGNVTASNGAGALIHYYHTGLFTLKMVGCTGSVCDSLIMPNYISISPQTPTPLVSLNGTQLVTPAGAGTYQWLINSSPMSGDTLPVITVQQDADYNVTVTKAGSCPATSATFYYYPVHPGFSADTASHCGVTTAQIMFIDSTLNATSYSWSFGDGATDTIQNPVHSYTAPGTYSVKLKACGPLGCDSLIRNNYIVVNAAPLISTISPADTTFICSGRPIHFHSNSTVASTYQWYQDGLPITGATDSIYADSVAGNFMLLVKNNMGCVAASNTTPTFDDFDCVWPGDVDNSFVIDNYDLLAIGVYYGSTGPSRASVSNTWSPYSCKNWGITETAGCDLKHADCNGDGVINSSDTLAINANYTLTHQLAPPHFPLDMLSAVPNIYLHATDTICQAGAWVSVDVLLGDSVMPAYGVYGIAFSVGYDKALCEPGSMSISYPVSWLGAGGGNILKLSKTDIALGTVSGAIVRTTHNNASGYGVFARLHFQTSKTLARASAMNFSIKDAGLIDSSATALSANVISNYTIHVTPVVAGIKETENSSDLSIYPNPYTDATQMSYTLQKNACVSLEIFDLLGRPVKTLVNSNQSPGTYKFIFSPESAAEGAGMYYVRLTIGGQVTVRKISRLNGW
jgi:PKD repeat protein/photosystem II stability/assembly factor-like uncharacterized protein